ncbi:MAG: DUF4340 domain-containing protein [Armatimonadota bacterium]
MSQAKKNKPLKGKGGLIAAAVIVLAGVALFWNEKAPVRDPDAPPPVSDYAGLTSADVTRVEVKRPESPFTLVKADGGWRFEAPATYRADGEAVESWLKGLLEDASVSQQVEGASSDLSLYGLDKPAAEVVLTAKDGKTRTLQIGKDLPTAPGAAGENFYARTAENGRVFMLSSTQVNDLKGKTVDSLRDKRLLALGEEDEIQSITLSRPQGNVELKRQGEDWQLAQPFQAKADEVRVSSFLGSLRSASAADFADDNAADLAKYGLDQPRLTVQVSDKGGQHAVHFGLEAGDKVYAVREGEREVMRVAKTTFSGLDQQVADLRDKELITLGLDDVTALELKNRHGTLRLERSGEDWSRVDGTSRTPADTATVQTVIDSVRAAAHRHVAEAPADLSKYGLTEPEITVTLNPGKPSSQVFKLGKKTPDGGYYAAGVPNAVFEVQEFVYTDLNVKPDALKKK